MQYSDELSLATDSTYNSYSSKERNRINNIKEYSLDYEFNSKELYSIAKLATYITNLPISFVSLVSTETTEILATEGTNTQSLPREMSMCHFCIQQDDFFEIKDTLNDDRAKEFPYIKCTPDPLRYYGGWPLKTKEGYNLGTICVCSMDPYELNANQIEALKTLADQIISQFELKRQNRLLTAANVKAEKLSNAKNEFISNMNHELRTPLNAINGYAEILSKTKLDDEQKEAVDIIKNSSDILITLVNDILDFSKINSEKLKLENIPFSLQKTTTLVYDLLIKKAKEKNINLENCYDEKIPELIKGDKIRINQIIMNLVGNAIKFTENGTVSINVELTDETEEDVTIYFSIKDTGIGIPEDKLEKIFERFEQAGTEITRKYGGTGLGLNISKNLVELYGGRLEVKSILGKGSEFFFTIKFDKINLNKLEIDSASPDSLKSDLNKFKLQKMRVLICEDNTINMKLIKHMFKGKVTHFEIAENGKVAIEILKRKMFDVILMDLHMPEMDGIETTKFIRNILKLSLPIIGFSASASQYEKNICLEVGMNDCIRKSFVSEELYNKMCSVLTFSKIYQEDLSEGENLKYIRNNTFRKMMYKTQKYASSLNLLRIYEESNKKNEYRKISYSSQKTISDDSSRFTRSIHSFKNHWESSKNIRNKFNNLIPNITYLDTQILNNRRLKYGCSRKSSFVCSEFNSTYKVEGEADSLSNNISVMKVEETKEVCSSDDSLASKSSKNKNIIIVSTNEDDEGLIQLDYLKEITCEDKNLEKDLIDVFLTNFPIEIETLNKELMHHNLKEVKFLIHKMKTPLRIFGLEKIIEKFEKLQFHCENNNYESALKLYDEIKNKEKIIYSELQKMLNEENYK